MKKKILWIGLAIFLMALTQVVCCEGGRKEPAMKATATFASPIPTSTFVATPTKTPTLAPASSPMRTATTIPIPQRKIDEWDYIEMPADDLLELWGEPLRSEKVGEDARGAIVEWWYEDVVVTLKRWELDGVTCYRVHEIRAR